MLGRGDLLAMDDAIRTALGVVRIGLRRGAGELLGLAAREPGAEPQAPPQPFARLSSEPHRCLTPLLPRPSREDDDVARSPCRNSSRRCSCERVISIESSEAPGCPLIGTVLLLANRLSQTINFGRSQSSSSNL